MKTRNLLMTLGVATLAAITLNLTAGEPLLSPRAKDSQSLIVPAVAGDQNLATENQNVIASPRTLGNQAKIVKGTESVNLTASKCNVVGSPKLAVMGSCCKMADSKCASTFACCAKN